MSGAAPAGRTTPLTRRERALLLAAALLYAAVVVPIGIHKGGDLATALAQSERLLHAAPLYERAPALGSWWPPFAVLALVPFALLAQLSLALAKGAWAVSSVACLAWSVVRAAHLWGWRPVLLALAAVAKPLQTNFEVLNINVVLLALFVAAAADLSEARSTRAGVWIGLATGLKAFPGLLLVYLAFRRHWKGLALGTAVAGGLTVVAVLPYGPAGALAAVSEWLALSLDTSVPAWARTSQSLSALFSRLSAPLVATIAVELASLAAAAAALRRRPPSDDAPYEPGLVILLAVLVSPVAWDHYYVLLFLGWVAAVSHPAPLQGRRAWYAALALAGIATSGLVLALSPRALRWELLNRSIYAWGAVLLLGLLLLQRTPLLQRKPRPV